jgi:hypothetical protein
MNSKGKAMTARTLATTLIPASVLLLPSLAVGQPEMVWDSTISVTSELIEGGRDMVVDDVGNAIVLGDLAVEQDFFVLKLDSSGEVLWEVIIGGSSLDNASDLEVDGEGDIYIAGRTLSADFPAVNAYQATKSGPSDAFLMKLNGDDGGILLSTYFGGTRAEWAQGIALGADGRVTIVGDTDSINLETVNPIQAQLTLNECFCNDFFVTQFSPAIDEVLFSSYLGGTFDDYSRDVSVDASGNIYVAGRTSSEDFPTLNAVQPSAGGGEYDAVVAKIASDYTLSYSTYLGGEDRELVGGIASDDTGAAYVTGSTRSVSFPTTPGALQEQFVGGINDCGGGGFIPRFNCDDMYVTKLAPDGAWAYSTFLGGHDIDEPRNVVVDDAGRAYVVGYTYSSDFPMDAPGGEYVAMRLNAGGSDLDFVISHDSPNVNSGGAVAVQGSDVFIAAKSGTINGNFVTYDTYVARFSVALQGDVNEDGAVDALDFLMIVASWGACPAPPDSCAADCDDSGTVDALDLLTVLANWGSS